MRYLIIFLFFSQNICAEIINLNCKWENGENFISNQLLKITEKDNQRLSIDTKYKKIIFFSNLPNPEKIEWKNDIIKWSGKGLKMQYGTYPNYYNSLDRFTGQLITRLNLTSKDYISEKYICTKITKKF